MWAAPPIYVIENKHVFNRLLPFREVMSIIAQFPIWAGSPIYDIENKHVFKGYYLLFERFC